MPLYRLLNADTEEALRIRGMSRGPRVTSTMAQKTAGNGGWALLTTMSVREGAARSGHRGLHHHSMQVIERYLDQEAGQLVRERSRCHSIKDKFRNVMSILSPEWKQAIHAFITSQYSHSFRAGLRLGINEHIVAGELEKWKTHRKSEVRVSGGFRRAKRQQAEAPGTLSRIEKKGFELFSLRMLASQLRRQRRNPVANVSIVESNE